MCIFFLIGQELFCLQFKFAGGKLLAFLQLVEKGSKMLALSLLDQINTFKIQGKCQYNADLLGSKSSSNAFSDSIFVG